MERAGGKRPGTGIFPECKKRCFLIVKPCKEEAARERFAKKAINVTTEGHKHLGAVLGPRSQLDEYVCEKVVDWVNKVTRLVDFAVSQPWACYCMWLSRLWVKDRRTYFLKMLPDIDTLLEQLELAIAEVLIPSITECNYSLAEQELLELLVRIGGLGFTTLAQSTSSEFEASVNTMAPLVNHIVVQTYEPADEAQVYELQWRMCRVKDDGLHEKCDNVKSSLPKKI